MIATTHFPVSSLALTDLERSYVRDCIDNNELSWNGRYVSKFEEAFAKFCGTKYAVACSNGTSALHLALMAAGVGPGDDVYVPAVTYVATANAVRHCGANPVIVDICPKTWGMDPHDLVFKIHQRIRQGSRRCKAIIPVHLYGFPCDITSIMEIAATFGAIVIEDAAQAHGAKVRTQLVGSIGGLGTFSFYANKMITCGEGGAVVTNNACWADRVRHLLGQATCVGKRFFHNEVGYNYRMTNMQAAIGYGQIQRYPENLRARLEVALIYASLLESKVQMQRLLIGTFSVPWLFTVLVPLQISRDLMISQLANLGIETRPVFVPLTELPMYVGITPPIAEDVSRRGISLPTHASMTVADARYIADEFLRLIGDYGAQ